MYFPSKQNIDVSNNITPFLQNQILQNFLSLTQVQLQFRKSMTVALFSFPSTVVALS
jgi:hypothetical protein